MTNISYTYVHPLSGVMDYGILKLDATTSNPVSREFLSQMHFKKYKAKKRGFSLICVKLPEKDLHELFRLYKVNPPVHVDHQVIVSIKEFL